MIKLKEKRLSDPVKDVDSCVKIILSVVFENEQKDLIEIIFLCNPCWVQLMKFSGMRGIILSQSII